MELMECAQRLAEWLNDQALARARRQDQATEEQAFVQGDVVCVDCGCRIPDERLIVVPGACRCVDCQEMTEQRSRHIARARWK